MLTMCLMCHFHSFMLNQTIPTILMWKMDLHHQPKIRVAATLHSVNERRARISNHRHQRSAITTTLKGSVVEV